MKTLKLIPILLSLLFLATCKKDPPIDPEPTEPIMPPLTHQGLNTFGCYIDGELFVAGGGDSYWDLPPLSGSFDENEEKLSMQATRYLSNDVSEYINIRSYCDDIGIFDFTYNEEYGSDGYTNWGGERCDYYFRTISDFDLGKLTITYLNAEKNIIAGTFYINLVNENCTDGDTILKITDGRFDFKY